MGAVQGITFDDDTISSIPISEATSYKIRLIATNPVKSVKKNVTLKVSAISVSYNNHVCHNSKYFKEEVIP